LNLLARQRPFHPTPQARSCFLDGQGPHVATLPLHVCCNKSPNPIAGRGRREALNVVPLCFLRSLLFRRLQSAYRYPACPPVSSSSGPCCPSS
jgi:hypothetical protein